MRNHQPAPFVVRTVVIEPGGKRRVRPHPGQAALVVVDWGEIELECRAGSRARFGRGAMLCFDVLPLRAVSNAGAQPAVLRVIARG